MEDLGALDYYELLGVSRDASAGEIHSRHRSLVQRLHPDRYTDLSTPYQEHFDGLLRKINAARDTLTDPERRYAYDLSLTRQPDHQRTEQRRGQRTGAATDDASCREAPWPGGAHSGPRHHSEWMSSGDPASGRVRANYEKEMADERAAAAHRDRMMRGEGGTAARLAYSAPPFIQRVALLALSTWAYVAAFWTLYSAGYGLYAIASICLVPLGCRWAYRRWGRMTARVAWPYSVRWPGFAPYNSRWAGREALISGFWGAPVALVVSFVPGGLWALSAAGVCALVWALIWALALCSASTRLR